jgi:hypothetical protein
LGLVLGAAIAVADLRRRTNPNFLLAVLYPAILGVLFILLFSIQRGPKPPHYIVTSYIMVDLIAGLGLARALEILTVHPPRIEQGWVKWGAPGLILLLQTASAIGFYPYYITYYNPLMEALQPGIQNPTLDVTGYGVGLERAAAYLATKADAKDLTVMSANGYGSFSYYFPGRTIPINTFTLSDPQIMEVLPTSQYVVVDYYNQKRSNLVSDFRGIEPEQSIWINGIDFLHIYRASDFLARGDASSSPSFAAPDPDSPSVAKGRNQP